MTDMKLDYAWEKLYRTVTSMAKSGDDLRERLLECYASQLSAIDGPILEPLPENLRRRFVKLNDRLTGEEPVGDEGVIAATIRKMSDSEVEDCIESIVSLYGDVCRHMEPWKNE